MTVAISLQGMKDSHEDVDDLFNRVAAGEHTVEDQVLLLLRGLTTALEEIHRLVDLDVGKGSPEAVASILTYLMYAAPEEERDAIKKGQMG